jgi:hypothetical protein
MAELGCMYAHVSSKCIANSQEHAHPETQSKQCHFLVGPKQTTNQNGNGIPQIPSSITRLRPKDIITLLITTVF